MNFFLTSKLRSAAVLIVAAATLLMSAQIASALTASYTTGSEVPLSAVGYTATGETVIFTLNYAPSAGATLTVVENTGPGFIQGAFDNLANGAAVDLSFGGITYNFVAWYYGGKGNNDLVLLWRDTGLAAWGTNNGRLGDGTTDQRIAPVGIDQSGVLADKTIVQLVRGGSQSLALCSDGTVAAWGSNFYGQLGNGSIFPGLSPVLVDQSGVLSTKTVVAVSAGSDHSLALCSDGTLAAWGRNDNRQLGDGTTVNRDVPVLVLQAGALTGKDVVSIASGTKHNLAFCDDGSIASWGSREWGALGVGGSTSGSTSTPVSVDQSGVLSGKQVVSVATGSNHSMALCSDGIVATWGFNGGGVLGDNSTTHRTTPVLVNTADGVSSLFGKTVVSLAAGAYFSVALCDDGTVSTWGDNSFGQLGNNTTNGSLVPVAVNTTNGTSALFGKTVKAVAAGYGHNLALTTDGILATWGYNFSGQLGDNSLTDKIVPQEVNRVEGVSALAGWTVSGLSSSGSGSGFSLAIFPGVPEIDVEQPAGVGITDGGTVDFGSPGLAGTFVDRKFTIRNSGYPDLTGLAVTINGTDASQFSILAQPDGQLEPDEFTTFTVRFTPTGAGAKTAAIHIASNDGNENPYDINLTGTGTASTSLSAGYNNGSEVPLTASGLVATGNTVNFSLNFAPSPGTSLTVAEITGLGLIQGEFANLANGAVVDLPFGGGTYSFVAWYYGGDGNNDLVLLWRDTVLAAWGSHFSGQLGNGDAQLQTSVPLLVDQSGILQGKTIVQVARGGDHTLALCSDGTLAGWGRNIEGQLGDTTQIGRASPVLVNTGSGTSALFGKSVVAIAAGDDHSFALCADGTVAAWGRNDWGQLGDNTTTPRNAPVLVNSASGVSALFGKTVVGVAAGYEHSLALCADGTVVAWGYNIRGQLGDNSTNQRIAPVEVDATGVLSGRTVIALAAGYWHSVALCSDGTVASWGDNGNGTLGDNTTTDRHAPVAVNTESGTSALFDKTVTAIAAGFWHSVALCSDGMVAAWGDNGSGRLGDNTTTVRPAPVAVNIDNGTSALFGKTVVAIAAGGSHSLALCSDGTVTAWGENDFYRQLGDNSSVNRPAPVAVNTDPGVSALAGSFVSGLAGSGATTNHSVAIFGGAPEITVEQPVGTDLTDGGVGVDFGPVTLLGSSAERIFTIRNDGYPDLTGLGITIDGPAAGDFSIVSDPASSLAPGGSTAFTVRFQPVGSGARSATLHLASNDSDESSFDIDLSGTGTTVSGLSANFGSASDVPLMVSGLVATGNTVNISLNYEPIPGTNLTVVKNTGIGFIEGEFSNLANGDIINLPFNGKTYPFIAWYYGGDRNNDLVLLWRDTGLAGWGFNWNGQLGTGTRTSSSPFGELTPVTADQGGLLGGKTIVQLARGLDHSLVLTSDGKVYGSGNDTEGQLGSSLTSGFDNPTPVAVDDTGVLAGKTVVAIAAGESHSLALCSDGTIAGWGRNYYGHLGDNSTIERNVPVLVNTTNGTSALFGKTVVAIAAGQGHSLALCSDGSVVSWGQNGFRQLGDNTFVDKLVPVLVNTSEGISALAGKRTTSLAAGYYHSLALCADGTIVGWGRNEDGQLGDGTEIQSSPPVAVVQSGELSGKSVIALAAGFQHSLALSSDGSVSVWGYNGNGLLGDGTMVSSSVPVAVNTDNGSSALFGKTVSAIAAGYQHSLALCDDGTVASWGFNDEGRLGDNSTDGRDKPVAVNTTPGTSALAGRFVSALGGSGSTAKFSSAIFGGEPEIVVEQPVGVDLTDGGSVDFGPTALVGMALEKTFTIRNTGFPSLSGLGISIDGADASDFSLVSSVPATIAAASSATFTVRFAPTSSGAKTATLHIANSDLDENPFDIVLTGSGSSQTTLSATYSTGNEVPLATSIFTATGNTVNFALNYAPAPGTTLTVVEKADFGLIQGEFDNLPNGAEVNLSFGGGIYSFIAWYRGGQGGNDLVLLWRNTGLAAWGYNNDGQLGDATTTGSRVPLPVDLSGVLQGKTIVQIVRGYEHSMALASDGTVAAWGVNANGQLGDGSTSRRFSPVAVDQSGVLAGKTVIAIAAGETHSLALCSDGTVAAWGGNGDGQLGDNSSGTDRLFPVMVNITSGTSALFGKTVLAIVAGNQHTVALCSDGTLAAWGKNDSGQLGDNTSGTDRLAPVTVNAVSGTSALFGKTVMAITTGGDHNLALFDDGTLAAWGEGNNGQLGDNFGFNRLVPTAVNTDSGTSELFGKTVVATAAGGLHSLALCDDGTLVGWGSNQVGQLGDYTFGNTFSEQVLVAFDSALLGKTVVAIETGGSHSMALCDDGTVAAWGYNAWGQLGNDSITNWQIAAAVNTTPGTSALAGRFVSSLGGSGSSALHSMAIFGVGPEIAVEQPTGVDLTDGSDTIDFGEMSLYGGPLMDRTFTIRNNDLGDLTGLVPTVTGPDADQFSIISQPTAPVLSGEFTTFTVRFAPTVAGAKNATLSIPSNDQDENPFEITLTGTASGEFEWNEVVAAEWYNIYIQKDGRLWQTFWVDALEGTSWMPNVQLPAGNYKWWVRSWTVAGGYQAWLEQPDFTYAKVELISPEGTVSETRPLFEWTQSAHARAVGSTPGYYNLYIQRNGKLWKSLWIEGATVTTWQQPLEDGAMPPGNYKFWVAPWNQTNGTGIYSEPMECALALPDLIGPDGPVAEGDWTPEFSWTESPSADWYQLYIQRNGRLFKAIWLEGSASTTHEETADMPTGEYKFWVNPWSFSGGFGPWVGPKEFSIGIPVPLTPSGLQTGGETQPLFTWTGSAKHEWYQIYLQRNGAYVADPWLPSNQVVNESWDISVANPDSIPANLILQLTGGEHRWWIRAYNAVDGTGAWIEGPTFTIRED